MLRVKCKSCGHEWTRVYGVLTPMGDVLAFPCAECYGEVELVRVLT